jgi:hypothetical protein
MKRYNQSVQSTYCCIGSRFLGCKCIFSSTIFYLNITMVSLLYFFVSIAKLHVSQT